ncbi:MAG TPA: hypothetical protein VK928_09260 [Longimicrobiales bacterium]|nr:hypothetical protein [Longimicrobiales bacterium]
MKIRWTPFVISLVLAGCGGADREAAAPADTLTQRQRDSIVGASSLPGAGGVRRAMDVADSAAARQSVIDTIGG